jgi:hypothetical protein
VKHPTASEREQCVNLYSDGVLLKHLVETFGRHRVVISRWINQAGAKRGHKYRGRWTTVPSANPSPVEKIGDHQS